MDKPFKTFLEQVEILNTRMKTDKETIYYLMRNNYYSIINFYKDPFLIFRRREIYRNGTHFNDLKSLYEFDRNLRTLFFNYLTQIERFFKTMIAYHFSEHYGINNLETYLDENNYFKRKKTKHTITDIIATLQNIKNNNKLPIISHYNRTKKDNIPFWVVIHFLTFGELSKLFSVLFNDVKNKIVICCQDLFKVEYGIYLTIDRFFIGSFLKACSRFRNAAGHNERFYNYTFKESLNLSNTSGITSNNKKLFSIYEGLKFFLPNKEYEKLTKDLKILITNLEKDLNTNWETNGNRNNPLPINDILKLMDFPNDWHK